jgi:hypothetical protein
VSLTVTTDGEVVERNPPGRPRTYFTRADDRELVLQFAFREISEAGPAKLRRIIARIESARMVGSVTGGKEHTKMAADALGAGLMRWSGSRRRRALYRGRSWC